MKRMSSRYFFQNFNILTESKNITNATNKINFLLHSQPIVLDYISNLLKLQILQKWAVWFVANIQYWIQTDVELQDRKLLETEQKRWVQLWIFMYWYIHNLLPYSISMSEHNILVHSWSQFVQL